MNIASYRAPSAATLCFSDDSVSSYLAGAFDAPSPEAMAHHIAVCARCRILVGEAARGSGQVRSTNPGNPGNPGSTGGLQSINTLRTGESVCGRYQIVDLLGRGGMGEVYRAHDLLLGEVVALKTVASTVLDSEAALARMKDEVLLARRVTHPNVCRLFDFGVYAQPQPDRSVVEIPFLTMELLGGQTLGERLRRGGALTADRARPLWLQMVAGLEAIHRAGIVHRDFKSENVFLVPDGDTDRVVVMDLGLAHLQDRARSRVVTDEVVGTVHYMAPELIDGAAPHPGFDIYALGVVMFEMLAGRCPSIGGRLPEGLPARLTDAIRRCLDREPARRFRNLEEVRRALSPPPRTAGQRRLQVVAGLLGAGLAVSLLSWNPFSPWHQRKPTPQPVRQEAARVSGANPQPLVESPRPLAIDRPEATVSRPAPPRRARVARLMPPAPVAEPVPITVSRIEPQEAQPPAQVPAAVNAPPPSDLLSDPDDIVDPFKRAP